MLKSIFTWWNGATIGARFDIGRRAAYVGKDDTGNKYYEEKKPSLEGRKRGNRASARRAQARSSSSICRSLCAHSSASQRCSTPRNSASPSRSSASYLAGGRWRSGAK